MSTTSSGDEPTLLRNALGAFLAYGFHAARLSELEAATGLPWDEISSRYRDKEGLFLAAAEHGLADGSAAALGKHAEVLAMLERLERVNNNPRLRAIHKTSLQKMRAIAQAPPQNP